MFKKYEKRVIKKWEIYFFILIILAAIGFKIYSSVWPKATIKIDSQSLRVLVADTFQHRIKGWSGRKNMGNYDGMLFVFPDRGQHAMVMRDMNFPLDIIWIDGDTVVDMAPNLAPEPNRAESDLTPYFSHLPATLVLELPTGYIMRSNLKIGDKLEIIKD